MPDPKTLIAQQREEFLFRVELRDELGQHLARNAVDMPEAALEWRQRIGSAVSVNRGTDAAVARSEKDFGALVKSQYWPVRKSDPNQRAWTDDYSNIFGSVLRNLRQRNLFSDD